MKAGHKVEIYEQAPKLGEIGAGIQISANAMHVLRDLGLEAAIRAVGVQPAAYVFRLHDTGEVIQRFSLSRGARAAARRALHPAAPRRPARHCSPHRRRALDPGVVRLNHKVAGFAESDGRRRAALCRRHLGARRPADRRRTG